MPTEAIKKETIAFANRRQAFALFPTINHTPQDIAHALNITGHKAVILVLGGAGSLDETSAPRLVQLFGRGISRAAASAKAVIVDGGTKAGVMSMIGEGIAGRGYTVNLIGVAPYGKVAYPGNASAGTPLEPNHSGFILVEGDEWGSETPTMFSLSAALADKNDKEAPYSISKKGRLTQTKAEKMPVLALLAGGGQVSANEVLSAVRNNIPLIVIKGSGGIADEIATGWQSRDNLPDDPVLAEILSEGKLRFFQLGDPVKGMERLITRELGADNVLMQAWETFADYDMNAIIQQKNFYRLQSAIILLGIVATALAIIQNVFTPRDGNGNIPPVHFNLASIRDMSRWLMYYVLIVIPILLTLLITAANRFKQGSKWLLLRAGAESIKREIFRYRTRSMYYSSNPEQMLAQKIEDFTRRTMRTEVNTSSLRSYNKDKGFPPCMYASAGKDDGFSHLTPDQYVEVRLNDQFNYFRKKSVSVERQLKRLNWLTYIIGGIGTFLAATGMQIWIALTTAIVAAMGTYLGYRQTETTLIKYNQAATDLANVKGWWNALPSEQQALQGNIDSLVAHTEQVLQSEMDGWIQQMQNALAELRKEQKPVTETEEKKEPQDAQANATQPNANEQAAESDAAQPVAAGATPARSGNGEVVAAGESAGNEKVMEPGTAPDPGQKEPAGIVAAEPQKDPEVAVNESDGVETGNDTETIADLLQPAKAAEKILR